MRPFDPDTETSVEYVARLESEIERLLAALRRIADLDDYSDLYYARNLAEDAMNAGKRG